MKMNMTLSLEETTTMLDAAMDKAVALGYDDDTDTIDEMFQIIIAALSAMGITCEVEETEVETDEFGVPEDYDSDFNFEEEEEEEEEDDISYKDIEKLIVEHKGKRYLKNSDAKRILDFMKALIEERFENLPAEMKSNILCDMWCQFGKDFNIEAVLLGE